MRLKKRWLLATTLMFTLVLVLAGCEASTSQKQISVESQTADFYVNDFAGIFSEEQKASMMEKAVSFDEQTGGIQVVVTTVKSLQNNSVEDYAHAMYNQYGIGRNNMGALIILSTEDRKVRIEVGNNMEPYLTDSVSGRLMDENSMDHFRQDEFDVGLIKLQDAVIAHISSTVPENWNANLPEPETEASTSNLQTESPAVDEEVKVSTEKPQDTLSNDAPIAKEKTDKSGLVGIIGVVIAALLSFFYAIKEALSFRKYKRLYEEKETQITKLEHTHTEELETVNREAKGRIMALERQYKEAMEGVRRSSEDSLRRKDVTISSLQDDISSCRHEVQELKDALSASEEKFSRTKLLHPDIEEEIAEQIQQEYRDEALRIDQELSGIICQEPSKDKVSLFRNARSTFVNALPEVRQYVKTDKHVVERLCSESESLLREYERQQKEIADKAAAGRIDEQMEKIMRRYSEGSYSNYKEFEDVNRNYKALSMEQKAFVTEAILSAFTRLLKDAEMDFRIYNAAKESESRISSIIGSMYSAREDDRDKLKRAMNHYKSIPSEQLKYFDSSLYEKLKKFIRQADSDHEEQERRRRREREERERRQRQSMYSSHSSFGSHGGGSFGGHGGMSSGGGASRGF